MRNHIRDEIMEHFPPPPKPEFSFHSLKSGGDYVGEGKYSTYLNKATKKKLKYLTIIRKSRH